jgi:hypothetical protein
VNVSELMMALILLKTGDYSSCFSVVFTLNFEALAR